MDMAIAKGRSVAIGEGAPTAISDAGGDIGGVAFDVSFLRSSWQWLGVAAGSCSSAAGALFFVVPSSSLRDSSRSSQLPPSARTRNVSIREAAAALSRPEIRLTISTGIPLTGQAANATYLCYDDAVAINGLGIVSYVECT